MVQKRVCSFCGGDIEPGTGKMFVRKDGTVFFFCKLKCQKNQLNMGRAARWVRWTEVYARAKHGAPAEEKAEAAEAVSAEEADVPKEEEVRADFTLHSPKGKDIPQAVVDLIDKRFGPELSASSVEKNFNEFTSSASLRHALGLWYGKRHPGKKVTEVATAEYVAFLNTAQAKKILKDWLDEKAKKEKEGR